MADITYTLGGLGEVSALYPPAKYITLDPGLGDVSGGRYREGAGGMAEAPAPGLHGGVEMKTRHDIRDVVAHFTASSLRADGFTGLDVAVHLDGGDVHVTVIADGPQDRLELFARTHVHLIGPAVGGKAIQGKALMESLGVWNPMAGFPVNHSPNDGLCKWHLFPPIGLNVIGQKGILMMHYPPWQVLQQASFADVMTMARWHTVLKASGMAEENILKYDTIVDVNPIAAPGSGQSEYPNDYFPIMAASAFFDGPPTRDYIKSSLEVYLNGPEATGKRHTLPLLVCGSPLYDPQAPGWFRTAFKEHMPTHDGIPQSEVLQVGTIRIRPDSKRVTPYLVCNHQIAAGVTGKCTDDPSKIPDIRMYEAQDLVGASFLQAFIDDPDADPEEVKKQACTRWFGNETGEGPPKPPKQEDARTICALAQMDLFFVPSPKPHPKYTFEEAWERCAGAGDDPCGCGIAPTGEKDG